jgi:tetratricopeptide (TPR) repeat protein
MRLSYALAVVFAASAVAADKPAKKEKPAILLDGLSEHHHPVSTKNDEAQKFFDQGLRLIYAFNHDEARRSFQRAAELDADLAMAWWGIALAVGPNYNLDADLEQRRQAYDAVQKALQLSAKASEPERAYIQALSKRYAADPKADKDKLGVAYKQAMGDVSKRYPDDLDAATLYAESAMNLRPWDLWSHDGKAAEGTEEIVAVLESVLRRNPHHIGANHYYIHAVEASPTPERALPAADRLGKLVPGAGHLVHMPAHIYIRVGDYEAAALANEKAALVDRKYIHKFDIQGIYPMMYYSHNLHFLAVAHAMQGRYKDARAAAEQLVTHVGPHVKDMPMLEGFMPTTLLIDIRFGRWEEILKSNAPPSEQKIHTFIWHFARGMAQVRQGKEREAEAELAKLKLDDVPADAEYGPRNKARLVLSIPELVLRAHIQLAQKDTKAAINSLEKAVKIEGSLNYMEPSDWYLPVRETLGGVLLRSGDAVEAEKVFRADLERNRRSGRSLFGLRESLKAQKKIYDAEMVDQQFKAAWKNADVTLRVEDL